MCKQEQEATTLLDQLDIHHPNDPDGEFPSATEIAPQDKHQIIDGF